MSERFKVEKEKKKNLELQKKNKKNFIFRKKTELIKE